MASDELVEKGTVALSETTTHWLLAVAGTCVESRQLHLLHLSHLPHLIHLLHIPPPPPPPPPVGGEEPQSKMAMAGIGRGEVVVESASLDLEDRSTQTLDLPRYSSSSSSSPFSSSSSSPGRRREPRARRSRWQSRWLR